MDLRWILMVVALLAAACSSDGASTTDTTDVTLPSGPSVPSTVVSTFVDPTIAPVRADAAPIVVDGVVFEGESPLVLLRNSGDAPYDLTGHFLCNRPSYVALPAQSLAPGEVLEFAADGLGLDAADGELGLYTSASYDDPSAMLRYVQWGSAGHGRSATAVTAGLWTEGQFLDNGGASLFASTDDPIDASGWSVG